MGWTAALSPLARFAGARAGQAAFYRQSMATLSANRIGLCEASTGSGKSRAMAAIAIAQAQVRKTPVVIAAPTLVVLGQFWSEIKLLHKQGIGREVRVAFYPGVTEFADREKIQQYLLEEERPDQGVREWLEAGGPIRRPPSEAPLVEALLEQCQRHDVKLAFLMEDLRRIATEVNPDEFTIESGDNEIAASARAAAASADVILCTHAMLVRSHMSGWKTLPEPAVLMVDEAHEFERNAASIHSNRLSLHALRRRLMRLPRAESKSTSAGKAVAATRALIRALRAAPLEATSNGDTYIDTTLPDDVREALSALSLALRAKPVVASANRAIRTAIDVLDAAANAATGKEHLRASIEFSPDRRRFPAILVGRSSIGSILGDIWRTAAGGVILASATLVVPDAYGNGKVDYITDILALPRSRLDAHPPITEKWVMEIPVMHIPERVARRGALAADGQGPQPGLGRSVARGVGAADRQHPREHRRRRHGLAVVVRADTRRSRRHADRQARRRAIGDREVRGLPGAVPGTGLSGCQAGAARLRHGMDGRQSRGQSPNHPAGR